MKRTTLVAFFLVAACEPGARSADYFAQRPEEAARVLAACVRGVHRGHECETAKQGEAIAEAEARQALFRRGFE